MQHGQIVEVVGGAGFNVGYVPSVRLVTGGDSSEAELLGPHRPVLGDSGVVPENPTHREADP